MYSQKGVMTGIHGALQAIGYGLLVLFFAVGVMKTYDKQRVFEDPEHAFFSALKLTNLQDFQGCAKVLAMITR